jgi:DNA-binding HxlR family transcriptional regulator
MLRTARQRSILCRTCPIARVADILGDSVSIIMLRDLLTHPSRRFTDFEFALAGVSSRTIALKLKKLEACGFISRDAQKRYVPRVDYRITAKGRALKGVIEAMRTYGKKYL